MGVEKRVWGRRPFGIALARKGREGVITAYCTLLYTAHFRGKTSAHFCTAATAHCHILLCDLYNFSPLLSETLFTLPKNYLFSSTFFKTPQTKSRLGVGDGGEEGVGGCVVPRVNGASQCATPLCLPHSQR